MLFNSFSFSPEKYFTWISRTWFLRGFSFFLLSIVSIANKRDGSWNKNAVMSTWTLNFSQFLRHSTLFSRIKRTRRGLYISRQWDTKIDIAFLARVIESVPRVSSLVTRNERVNEFSSIDKRKTRDCVKPINISIFEIYFNICKL